MPGVGPHNYVLIEFIPVPQLAQIHDLNFSNLGALALLLVANLGGPTEKEDAIRVAQPTW